MSKRFELSLSVDYIKSWGTWEAIREFWQNAIDYGEYDWTWQSQELRGKPNVLRIISKNVQLEKKTLLMGISSKQNDSSKIGNFGEGYKLAALVLTRIGKQVKIYNNKACEVWLPKIIKSRRYDSELLVFDIETHVPDDLMNNNLVFEVTGISKTEWNIVMQNNLNINVPKKTEETSFGEILFDKGLRGKVFVGGLFVCDIPVKGYRYGYDIKPQHIELDRDRQSVRGFDFQWITSRMWGALFNKSVRNALIYKLIESGAPDVSYLNNFVGGNDMNVVGRIFLNKHGDKSVAVSNDDEFKQAKRMYGDSIEPVIVNSVQKEILSRSSVYRDNISSFESGRVLKKKPRGVVGDLYNELHGAIPESDYGGCYNDKDVEKYIERVNRTFNRLLDMSEEWRWEDTE